MLLSQLIRSFSCVCGWWMSQSIAIVCGYEWVSQLLLCVAMNESVNCYCVWLWTSQSIVIVCGWWLSEPVNCYCVWLVNEPVNCYCVWLMNEPVNCYFLVNHSGIKSVDKPSCHQPPICPQHNLSTAQVVQGKSQWSQGKYWTVKSIFFCYAMSSAHPQRGYRFSLFSKKKKKKKTIRRKKTKPIRIYRCFLPVSFPFPSDLFERIRLAKS